MDLPLAIEQLTRTGRILPTDDGGPCANTGDTYADFAKGWRGKSPVPTEVELQAAFDVVKVSIAAATSRVEADRLERTDYREKVDAVLGEIDADLVVLAGANNTQLKAIVGRMLARQRRIVKHLAKLLG